MSRQGPRDQEFTLGNARVALPNNTFGVLTAGEVDLNVATGTITQINFASGLVGITIDFVVLASANLCTAVYIAFPGTAFHDATVAGQRFIIQAGDSKTISFSSTDPKPSSMQINTFAASGAADRAVLSYTVVTE